MQESGVLWVHFPGYHSHMRQSQAYSAEFLIEKSCPRVGLEVVNFSEVRGTQPIFFNQSVCRVR